MIKLVECPRDAMQGWPTFIPTETKVTYLNTLLKVGFDTIDFGSFVSPKAIPQLKDTHEVVEQLDLNHSKSKLLAIIANTRGAEEALSHGVIDYLGFPLSISEVFQRRNTNKSIEEALEVVGEIQNLCVAKGKELVTYISMGFGNPYGDPYSAEVVIEFVKKLDAIGIKIVSLADTIGVSRPDTIEYLFSYLIPAFSHIEFGAHLHSTADSASEKIKAAYDAGCQRFDSAIRGFGGCPMAKNELVGNIATERLIETLKNQGAAIHLDDDALKQAWTQSSTVFL